MTDLLFRTWNACDELSRYGGVYNVELVEVLEQITEINDDLHHGRDPELIRSGIEKAKALLDQVPSV